MKGLLRHIFPLSLRVRFLLATAGVVLVLSLAYGMVALVGYSVVILCCIFVENDIEVEEESTGKLYFHILLNAILTGTFQVNGKKVLSILS